MDTNTVSKANVKRKRSNPPYVSPPVIPQPHTGNIQDTPEVIVPDVPPANFPSRQGIIITSPSTSSSLAVLMPKQSLLAALGKPGQRPGYQAPPSAYQQSYSPSLASSDESHENSFLSSAGSIHQGHPGAQRSVSNSTTTSQLSSMYGRERATITPRGIRRVDDVYHLVKERVAQWSYLMQWYNGDTPWLNSVHVGRAALESTLGAKVLDTRARQEYALGLSLAALFDLNGAPDFLRGANKLLEEWDAWTESGEATRVLARPIRNFFRPRQVKPRGPTVATNTATAEVTIAPVDETSVSFLVLAVMPFTPDFFQVHASTCSIMRDVYKKLLAMILPPTRGVLQNPAAGTLLHPSTLVLLGPNDGSGPPVDVASDANLLGEMPNGLTLVGEGQKLTPAVIDLLLKVDAKLKKHYAYLVKDGDTLARSVLDSELAALSTSMNGGPALSFHPPSNTWAETVV